MLKSGAQKRAETVLGIDIGASKLEWALLGSKGICDEGRIELDSHVGNGELTEKIWEILQKTGAKRVGISIAGFVQGKRVLRMPNLPKIEDFELCLKNTEINVQNDVKCAALAIWAKRGKKEDDSFVVVSVGSGIGGALVQSGKLVYGNNNLSGEFGHMKFPFERVRGKPQLIEWESFSSGRGVQAQFASIARGNPNIGKKYPLRDAKGIFESDSVLAKRVCTQAAFYFGVGLANISNVLNPSEIVLTGSVSKAYVGKYEKAVREAFESAVIVPLKATKITASGLENPALMGSILLTKKNSSKQINSFLGG